MHRLVLALSVLATPAVAEDPQISLVFGPDRLSATSEDIRSLRRVDEKGFGSALIIELAPVFDVPLRDFTTRHVGETGVLLICGQTVIEPHLHAPIPEATFVISDTDPGRIDRLEAMLASADCAARPTS
jgi:hypothetical protein